MKRIIAFSFYFLAFCAHAELPIAVADALKKANIPLDNVGVYVQAVDDAKPIIAHNSDKSFNTASVMKLVTSNAALEILTPAYRWKTEVYRDGELKNGVLNGNLILKGYGDPSFKAQDFWRLLMALQQAGIKEINGHLILDKTAFAENLPDQPPFDQEIWRSYNAKSSAFLVDGRRTSFKFSTTDNAVNIQQEFALDEVEIVNNLRFNQAACADWRSRFSYDVTPKANGATVTFSGEFSPDCGERYLELSVLDDTQYAFYSFKKIWRELGGRFNGTLLKQPLTQPIASSAAVKVLTQLSEPLGYVIRDLNKWSNNLMARQLLLTLALEKQSAPATEAQGAAVIADWLKSKNIHANELVIENGSGLSRIEQINSAHLGQMLVSTYNGSVMPELMSSLPILGLDGTVQTRLKNSPAQGRAHLKTGSIDGVSAIAGYILGAHGKRYALVMMVNDVKAFASRQAQDALIEHVADN